MSFPARPLAVLAALLCAGTAAWAQTPASPGQELGQVKEQMEQSAQRQKDMAAAMAETVRAENELSQKLVALARTLQEQEQALTLSEDKLRDMAREAVVIRAELAAKQDRLAALLAGLQRLEQNPPPALVVEPANVLDALRSAMLFGAVVPDMRGEARELARRLERLDQIHAMSAAEKARAAETLTTLQAARAEVAKLIAAKQQERQGQEQALAAERSRAADLAQRAQSLQQLLDQLTAARAKAEAEKTAAALALEQERKRQEALLLGPKLNLAEAKGKLAYPVQGDILKRFGEPDGLGGSLKGMAIATREGAQVVVPADGRIEFAGPFRSYGQLLILDAGEGYLMLLAGLETMTAATGQTVRAGEPVGTMGKGPSSVTLLGDQVRDNRPVLYVELRKNGDTINSAPWWLDGRREAHR